MLRNTFIHIPGIGVRTERGLWSSGILSWDAFSEYQSKRPDRARKGSIATGLAESMNRLDEGDPHYFEKRLSSNHVWRLFPEFRESIAYLDIETTGLVSWGSHITTIAVYDGRSIYHYVHGENLHDFTRDIQQYKVIVTYNGRCFDIPFIRRSLELEMNHVHIDLRYLLRSLGYQGGLKACEKSLGIDRGELNGVDGFFAVLLWDDFRRNENQKALETLLAYNIQDVVNLEALLVLCYNLKLRETPFSESHRLPLSSPPIIPFEADEDTIWRIRHERLMGYGE